MIRFSRFRLVFLLPAVLPTPAMAQLEQKETTEVILAALEHVKDRIPPGAVLASALAGRNQERVPDPALLISGVARRFGYEVRDAATVSRCIVGKPVLVGAPALIQLGVPEQSGRGKREVVIGWTFNVGGSSAGKSVWLELEQRNGRWVVVSDLGEERTSVGCRPPGGGGALR